MRIQTISWIISSICINLCLLNYTYATELLAYDSTAGYFIEQTPEGYVVKKPTPYSGNERDRVNQVPRTFYGQPDAY